MLVSYRPRVWEIQQHLQCGGTPVVYAIGCLGKISPSGIDMINSHSVATSSAKCTAPCRFLGVMGTKYLDIHIGATQYEKTVMASNG